LKLLANENVPAAAVELLRSRGHDVGWIKTDSPGATDDAVLARARADDPLLITFDKDFGELVFSKGRPASAGIILFRVVTSSPAETARKVADAIDLRDDWAGHFSVVDETKVRMIPLSPPAPRHPPAAP